MGEVARGGVAPAHRDTVRRFFARFAGRELKVALELDATTGWRFVVEELDRIGARAHLAEPEETSALRGNKKRPKTDRADARHLRELLMAGRLPLCWIPPEHHLLDLRTQVRLRHTLVDDRGCWQQRIHAVLYHHGIRQRKGLYLLSEEGRSWLAQATLPTTAREQVIVRLQMIDALNAQLPPIEQQLRACARRQTGCRELTRRHYGIGELTSVAILAELGDARRFTSSRHVIRYGGLDITVHQSDQRRAPATSPAKDLRCCAGRSTKPPKPPPAVARQTATTTCRQAPVSGTSARAWRSRANCSNAAPHPARTRR
jgi:transposase